jgi:hypothetical protein
MPNQFIVMCILTSLPDAILSTVLSDWLTAAHVARLDSACCRKDTRSMFIQSAYRATTNFSNPFPDADLNHKNIALDGMVMWLLKRSAVMAQLYVTDSVTKNEELFVAYLANHGTAVQKVILLIKVSSDRIADAIGMHCTSVVAFQSEVMVSANVLSRIVGNSQKLTDISLLGQFRKENLHAITHHCQRLEKLKLVRNYFLTEDTLTDFVSNCHRLKYLHVGLASQISGPLSETFFEGLAANCPELTELHICHVVISEGDISALAEGCHKLQTLCLLSAYLDFPSSAILAVLPSLLELTLEGKSAGKIQVKPFLDSLLRCFPSVRKLSLSGLWGVTTHELLAAIAHLSHLQFVHLGDSRFLTDTLLRSIAHSCPDLQSVSLRCCSYGKQYQQRTLVRGPALPPVTGPDNATREQQLASAQEVLSGCCKAKVYWPRTKNEWHELSSEGLVTLFEDRPSLMRVKTHNCGDSGTKEGTYELWVHCPYR